ncbi:GntR family transcriptional regulator [Desertivirga brevis]|uniref:GntR family transcriptional regulator n=1 Tax=Desertivirga brevis TaxID=2810310 RepID=UPI0034E24261
MVDYLNEQIKNGVLLPEEQLLPPKKQAPLFKVSHYTVSSAYDMMTISGLIYRVPGQGTYVSPGEPEPLRDIQNILSHKPSFKFRPLSKPSDDKDDSLAWLQVGLESPEYKDLRDIEFARKYQKCSMLLLCKEGWE